MSRVCVTPCAGPVRFATQVAALAIGVAAMGLGGAQAATAPSPSDPIVKARAAYQHRDRAALAVLRKSTAAQAHPLAMWVDYWELSLRLRQAKQADLEAFYARWPDTAVAQLLRRDWIVERGKVGDAEALALELPRVRSMASSNSPEQREIECHALMQRHAVGETSPARRTSCGSRSANPTRAAPCLRRRCTVLANSRATTSGRVRAWVQSRAGASSCNTRSRCSVP